MPNRPKQHQLEDLSRAKYNLIIPKNWVMRDKDKDYGIDAEVEIFDDKNKATGLVYLVQLKATGSKDIKVIRSIDLSVSTIEYYEKLELPVLLVRYSEKNDIFYFKWMHAIDYPKNKNSVKTKRVTFSDEDVWNHDTPEKVINHIKRIRFVKSGDFSLPVLTFMENKGGFFNGNPHSLVVAGFRKAMQTYPQFIKDHKDRDKCLLVVNLNGHDLQVNLASIAAFSMKGLGKIEIDKVSEKIVELTLVGLAATLVDVGHAELAVRIFLNERLQNIFFCSNDFLHSYIHKLINTSRYSEVIDVICEHLDSEDSNFLEAIATMSLLSLKDIGDKDKCQKYQQLLDKSLEKNIALGLDSAIGSSHYNLGNHYRSISLMKKSIYHYLMARKFESDYLNRHYYYEELAGVLFEMGRYGFSAKIYKIAIEKGSLNSVKALYADALMFSGKYKLAKETFAEYLDTTEAIVPEWYLKYYCLESLIDNIGIETQVRLKKEAVDAIEPSKVDDVDSLIAALKLDLLFGDAWFNLGIVKSKSNKNEEAVLCFLLSALINRDDVEAWVNATLVSFNKAANAELLYMIISTAYFFNNEDYILALHKELSLHAQKELYELVTNMVDEIIQKEGEPKYPRVARMGFKK